MPELPEVETVCRGLSPLLINHKIIKCEKYIDRLRTVFPPNFEQLITQARVINLHRRGKYIIIELDNSYTWIIHLGMSGKIRAGTNDNVQKHDHVIWQTDTHRFAYNDPRRFGQMSLYQSRAWERLPPFATMGLEPFDARLNEEVLYELLKNKTTSIKVSLLDQNIIAGLGNIYIAESLWQVGIHPLRSSNRITLEECEKMLGSVKNILMQAIDAGGTTLRDHRSIDGNTGYFQNFCQVYGQAGKPCQKIECSGTIQRITQSGRGSFFCDICQK